MWEDTASWDNGPQPRSFWSRELPLNGAISRPEPLGARIGRSGRLWARHSATPAMRALKRSATSADGRTDVVLGAGDGKRKLSGRGMKRPTTAPDGPRTGAATDVSAVVELLGRPREARRPDLPGDAGSPLGRSPSGR